MLTGLYFPISLFPPTPTLVAHTLKQHYPLRMTTTMSAEDRLELVETAKRLEPLKRAARRGRANGLGYVVFGGLSLLLSISSNPDWIGLLIGLVLIGAGLV